MSYENIVNCVSNVCRIVRIVCDLMCRNTRIANEATNEVSIIGNEISPVINTFPNTQCDADAVPTILDQALMGTKPTSSSCSNCVFVPFGGRKNESRLHAAHGVGINGCHAIE